MVNSTHYLPNSGKGKKFSIKKSQVKRADYFPWGRCSVDREINKKGSETNHLRAPQTKMEEV